MNILKIESNSKVIFGGLFGEINKENFKIQDEEEIVNISPHIFLGNELKNLNELKLILSKHQFDRIISEGEFKVMDVKSLGYYKSYKDLYCEYIIIGNKIYIFSFGEKQPSLWFIILEGIWKIEAD